MHFLPGEEKAPRCRTCLFHKPAKVQAARMEPLPSHVARSILSGEGFPEKRQTFEAETSLASPKGCEKPLFSFSCQVTFVLLNVGTVPVLSWWTLLSQLSQGVLPWISLENSTQMRTMAFATPKGLLKERQQQLRQRISKWVAQAWLPNFRIMSEDWVHSFHLYICSKGLIRSTCLTHTAGPEHQLSVNCDPVSIHLTLTCWGMGVGRHRIFILCCQPLSPWTEN